MLTEVSDGKTTIAALADLPPPAPNPQGTVYPPSLDELFQEDPTGEDPQSEASIEELQGQKDIPPSPQLGFVAHELAPYVEFPFEMWGKPLDGDESKRLAKRAEPLFDRYLPEVAGDYAAEIAFLLTLGPIVLKRLRGKSANSDPGAEGAR